MGTYTTLNTYDGESRIPDFLGLNQRGNTVGTTPTYAVDACGMDTVGGTLQPFAAVTVVDTAVPTQNKIETLMHLHRRWPNQNTTPDDIIFAAANGSIYFRAEKADGETWGDWGKVTVYDEDGNEQARSFAFGSNVWSCSAYERNVTGKQYSIDVLLVTNASDGLWMIQENGNGFDMTPVSLGSKPAIIERSNDRIWGTGVTTEPDLLIYSRYLDPLDWTQVASGETITETDADGAKTTITTPEWYGGGDISQPSWDGNDFVALKSFGSYLLAFKRSTIWQISGTNPGEYTLKEQYGGGCKYPNTIAVDAEKVYMLSDEGVMYYNGSTTQDFNQGYCQDIWDAMNRDALDQSCAVLFKDKYYLSIPINGSTVNNCVVIYSVTDGTWLVRKDISVESWMATENRLYFTTVDAPYNLCIYEENSWLTGKASTAETYWETPWINLNYQHWEKGPFTVYFTPEVQDKPVDICITLFTESRQKTKTVRVHPLLEYEQNMKYSPKQRAIRFYSHGYSFKLRLSTDAGDGAPWRINGGILTIMDVQKEIL